MIRPGTILILAMLSAAPAAAQENDDLFARDTLTGSWGGFRGRLGDAGIVLGGDEILDALGNVSGGVKQGLAFEGRFEVFANVDLDAALGWKGGIFHANAYQIHGKGLSSDDVGNILTVGNIGATPATRLFTAWLQQSLFDDTLSIRAGQIAADDEFFVSPTATLFVNSTFGWPSILGINLPSGGPAYPLATPGIRMKEALSPELSVSAGLFNGDPAPAGAGDPQQRDAAGTALRTDGGLFSIAEADYATNVPLFGDAVPGTFKLGAWYHDGAFADQRFDAAGRSLADPAASAALLHRDNFGVYFIADQLLWRSGASGDQGLSAFIRLGGAPDDRNLIAFHVDGGVTYTGLLPGRDNDVAGIGVSYEGVSAERRALAQDARHLRGFPGPLPDFESALEISYQARIAPWWVVQPDVQLILHPGARLFDVSMPAPHAPDDALVTGFRTAIGF